MKDGSNNVHILSCGSHLQDGVNKLHRRAKTLRAIELAEGFYPEAYLNRGLVYKNMNNFEPRTVYFEFV